MEAGENIEETARSELSEKTGLAATKLRLLNVFSGKILYYIGAEHKKLCSRAAIRRVGSRVVLNLLSHYLYKGKLEIFI